MLSANFGAIMSLPRMARRVQVAFAVADVPRDSFAPGVDGGYILPTMRQFIGGSIMDMRILAISMLAVFLLGGCGGYYVLTVPDQHARTGGETYVVSRLERSDLLIFALPVEEAAMRVVLPDGEQHASYSDRIGYASTRITAPEQPGVYMLEVSHGDYEGEIVRRDVPLYVWRPDEPVVAIDMACLPSPGSSQADAAREALTRLAERAHLVYLTRSDDPQALSRGHSQLRGHGYPDGPVLVWRHQRWHIVRDGPFRLPHIVVESRMVSQLPQLREEFPRLGVGVTHSETAAQTFRNVGMTSVLIGSGSQRASWADVGEMSF